MIGDDNRRLDVREAARILYKTPDPTPQQVDAVRRELARGSLAGNRDGLWTTNQAVADYLAGRTHERRAMGGGRGDPTGGFVPVPSRPAAGAGRTGGIRSNDTLVTLYQDLLRDYFLAVLRRQKQQRRSKFFERAVVAGQVACLLMLLGVFVFGLKVAQSMRQPPEQVAVERWIAENSGDYHVIRWYPTEPARDGGGAIVRVEYQYYSPSRKGITTDRSFEVRGDQVTVAHDSEP
jgi:hypothetical protein